MAPGPCLSARGSGSRASIDVLLAVGESFVSSGQLHLMTTGPGLYDLPPPGRQWGM